MLDFTGDIGGLYDGLSLIIKRMIRPLATLALNSKLLTLFFKHVKGKGDETEETTQPTQIPKKNFFLSIALCGRKNRYRKMIDRAEFMIKKQLDLVQFVHQQRLLMLNLLTTLTMPQINAMAKLNEFVINESSDLNDNDRDKRNLNSTA